MDIAGSYTFAVCVLFVVYIASSWSRKLLREFRRKWQVLAMIPAPEYHWFLGHLRTFPGLNARGLDWFLDATTRHPRYYVFQVGPLSYAVHLNHPEPLKKLAATTEPKQLGTGGAYRHVKPWIGDGLLLSSGAKWHRNRRLLTPGFHFDILKQYVDVYNDCADILLSNIEAYAVKPNQSIDVFKPVGLCAFDIIMRCAFSSVADVQDLNDEHDYYKTVNFLSRKAIERCFKPLVYNDSLYALTRDGRRFAAECEFSHRFAESIIAKRKLALQSGETETVDKGRMTDFLDILLLARDDEGQGLTDLEIRDEVETFMFEGHDTTKSAISWCLYNLAKHPAIQSRARDEVNGVLHGRIDRRIRDEDMTSLAYLTRCIKESMRMHPPVPFIGRTLENPLEIDPGKILPAGTNVTSMIWCLHHNPEVWPDHMTYDPDRFLPENIKDMDSHAFLAFSAGPRNCIGQRFAMNEIRTVVARLLDRFEMKLDPDREAIVHPDAILRTADGMYIYFENRSLPTESVA